MIDANWIKRHVLAGNIKPVEGITRFNPQWKPPYMERTLWRGQIDRSIVEFYPAGREIDMSTCRVRSTSSQKESSMITPQQNKDEL
jgi:hypothetical protein